MVISRYTETVKTVDKKHPCHHDNPNEHDFILLKKVLVNKNAYFNLEKRLFPSLTIWQGCSVSLAVSLISP